MSIRLWHDDVRPAPEGWVWARRNEEAQNILATGEVIECSLDHDLGFHDVDLPEDPEKALDVLCLRGSSPETGYDLVNWMTEHGHVPKKVTIHSWNPDGARRMANILVLHGHDCIIEPYRVSL